MSMDPIYHVSPRPEEHPATAPYNFVPLPNAVYQAAEGIEVNGPQGTTKIKPWERHDEFVDGTHSGWIDLKIETLTPLYIRGAARQNQDGHWPTKDTRRRPEPFQTFDGKPVIPGSSLRGMVRTLVEILSFSKIAPVTNGKPFYRSLGVDRVGQAYRNRMARGGAKPRGGFIRLSPDGRFIEPCDFYRVDHSQLPADTYATRPNDPPKWPAQQRSCFILLPGPNDDNKRLVRDICFDSPASKERYVPATLVMSGWAPPHKRRQNGQVITIEKREFAFLDGRSNERLAVPDDIWQRFHDDDQITQWQKDAFPQGHPLGAHRPASGHLRNGEPVFYLCEEGKRSAENPEGLVFLGRAQMFRFPYDRSPRDLIPEHIENASLDLAEAMFGRKGDDGQMLKGRLRFMDAVADDNRTDWYMAVIVPRILSSPKPTAYPHYLTQPAEPAQRRGSRDKDWQTTYIAGEAEAEQDKTTIRGHKLYWHRWGPSGFAEVVESPPERQQLRRDLEREDRQPDDKQHTLIQPVRDGVKFNGRIHFENLTPLELGALLTALDLPEECAHKLGMGKPLGLGSVKIVPTLKLINRRERYRSWAESGVTEHGAEVFVQAFERAIRHHAEETHETRYKDQPGLWGIARLAALRVLLRWQGRPQLTATAQLRLSEFEDRRVLPTPFPVVGEAEPQWQGEQSRAAEPEADRTTAPAEQPDPGRASAAPAGAAQGLRAPARPARTAMPQRQGAGQSSNRGVGAIPAGKPRNGERGRWTFTGERKTRSGLSVFRQESGTVVGHLKHGTAEPPALQAGKTYDMVVRAEGDSPQLEWIDPDSPPPPGPSRRSKPAGGRPTRRG